VHPNLDESAPLIGAPDAWTLGLNGSGVRIAIIDTGIDASHPDFYFPNGTSKIERAVSFVDYDGDGTPDEPPDDYFGHGTHVASIAAGTGAKSAGRFKGIAHGAKLWNVKVLNKWGWGYLSWVIAGVEYAALGPDYTPNSGDEADVLSLSLGAYWWTDGTDPLSMACDAAVDAGRAVVVAAGNWGDYFGIGVPATARKVITVGATDKQDGLAWFSSCGPTIDYRVKPDIVAPGVDIWAACAKGSRIEYWANQTQIPGIDVDGDGRYDYVRLSGTSMSTPHVSGAAALLKQLSPHLTPNEIKNILISTAKDLGYNAYQQGGGRVNITSAISTPVLVDPATISLGAITEDKLVNTTITFAFRPLLRIRPLTNITLSLEATVREIFTGSVVNAARLNTTVITIPFNESRAVLLTINTTLPKSIYEGRVTAKVVGGPWGNRTVHAILGFARLNNLTINMIDRKGFPAAYRPVLFFQHNAPYYLWGYNFWFTYTDWNGVVRAYVPDGEFYVIGHDWDYSVQATVWMIADRAPIYGNTVIILDERSAGEVNFDPAKPNQVFAAKRSSINYCSWWLWLQWTSLWYYPSTALTYMTNTTLGASFSYEYYNKDYLNVAWPDVIDAPEWHNLIYWQSGIAPPVTYVANYSSLVKRVTEYRVPMTPKLAARLVQHKWSPLEWSSWEIAWVMNVPRARVEWLTPDVYYYAYCWKYRDPPWISTPFWYFDDYGWPGVYPPSIEFHERWGQHPFQTWLDGYSWDGLELYGHVFVDSSIIPHCFHNWERYPAGHVKVWRNSTLIWEGDVNDYFWIYLGGQPYPSRFKVAVNGSSGQHLSTRSYYDYEFVRSGPSGYWFPRTPPVWIDGLDLNNTHAAGDVEGCIPLIPRIPFTSDDYRLLRNITLEYSVDDGATWRSVPLVPSNITLPVTIAGKSMIMPGYRFTLANLSDVYVSLRVNATYTVDEIRQSQTTIRAFYVRPLVVITVGPPGSGAQYTKISEAVRESPAGARIEVLPGTYAEHIVVDRPLTIVSRNGSAATEATNPVVVFEVLADNVKIEGLTIRGGIIGVIARSSLTLAKCAVKENVVNIMSYDRGSLIVKNSEVLRGSAYGVVAHGGGFMKVINSTIHDNGAGVLASWGSEAVVVNSEIYNNIWGALAYDTSSISIVSSTVHNNTDGITGLGSSRIIVNGSEVYFNNYGVVARSNSRVRVEDSTVHNNVAIGILVADAGEVIASSTSILGSMYGVVGFHNSCIVVSSSSIGLNRYEGLLLVGNSKTTAKDINVTNSVRGVTLLMNSSASLRRATIENTTVGLLALDASSMEGDSVVVRANQWGAVALGSSAINLVNSLITNNTYDGAIALDTSHIRLEGSTLAYNTRGITLLGNGSAEVIGSRISDNDAEGLLLTENSRAAIYNSSVALNHWGLILRGSAKAKILASRISNNTAMGLLLFDGSEVALDNSIVELNNWGVHCYDFSQLNATSTYFLNNTYEGIGAYHNSTLTILSYSAIGSNTWGILVGTGSHASVSVHNSSLSGNSQYAVLNLGIIPVNATYNWWGDPSGPYHPTLNPNGMGDRISDNVLFEPWLTAPPEQLSLPISGSMEYAGFTYGAVIVAKVCSGSLTGVDPLDAEAPPAPPEGLDMFFSIGDIKCLEDARPPTTTIAWRFTVRAVNVEGTATLTWDVSSVPSKYATITLMDEYTGMTIDMRAQTSYAFSLGAGESREFTIIAHGGG
jgi:hypothetical protein